MLQAITERGRRLLQISSREAGIADSRRDIEATCRTLLSSQGEASGMALAKIILDQWERFDDRQRHDFMVMLLDRFGADTARLDKAIDAYRKAPTPAAMLKLNEASEPRRQELIRRLNLAPGGVAMLVRMREALLRFRKSDPRLDVVDADFAHLFASWFNRGFLVLHPINWSTPADILEKIIRYEAVHQINGWDELRSRLVPEDRRCFAFFHPRLADDPLIFVEVALTKDIPSGIAELLGPEREHIPAAEATTAVFYSISNCQTGLRGISFGNFLIKQVVEDLRRELVRLDTFVTLSPAPGFAAWLARERETQSSAVLSDEDIETLRILDEPGWQDDPDRTALLRPVLTAAAAWYFLHARNPAGKAADPVARFHLGNGARLERINFLADRSANAMREAHGIMVNYLYKLEDIETNHEAFAGRGEVVASSGVKRLVPAKRPRGAASPTGEASARTGHSSAVAEKGKEFTT